MRVLRRIFGQRLRPDYSLDGDVPFAVDWAAGMFLLFDSAAYRSVGGFDERYFMYLEDADICHRLWAKGRRVIAAPSVSVVHDAQRASRRSLKHMRWHGASMARFLFFSH
jgi:GT2 family glycosyltransferase